MNIQSKGGSMPEQSTDQRRATPMTPGLFDKSSRPPTPKSDSEKAKSTGTPPEKTLPPKTLKEDFPDPFKIQDEMMRNVAKPKTEKDQSEKDIDSINAAAEAEMAKEDEDFMKISKEDLELAEQLIFNGYAETQVEISNFPGRKFAICSTNGEELTFIDEMAFDKMKSVKQNADGTIDMPDSAIKALRNSLFVALSYRGVDGKDIASEPIIQVNTLKKAILQLGSLYSSGDMKQADELKASVKKALLKRATLIRRLPAPVIDFLSDEKYKFDVKMLNIMSEKKILPKS
jgi:hypothetical protein